MTRRDFFGRLFGVAATMLLPPLTLLGLEKSASKLLAPPKSEIELLIEATLRDLGRAKFADISRDLRHHVAIRNLLKKSKVVFGA